MIDLFTLPELPYAGTSGFSGTRTSELRARRADKDGTTGKRQRATISALKQAGRDGLTWKELSDATGWHHGTASGSLSVLHKTEHIARLTETRNRCKVYVLPEHVEGRDTERHRGSMKGRVGNLREASMMTERQADVLIQGHDTLVASIARTLDEEQDRNAQAERVIATVADWLCTYRPSDFGDDYCPPLDLTAFILRKGEVRDR